MQDVLLAGADVDALISVLFDPAGHEPYIALPENIVVNVIAVNGNLVISGPAPWVEITDEWDPATGAFTGTGRGTVAGFSDIAVTFEGTMTEEGIRGELTMGAAGGLPTGQPARYLVIGDFPADLFETPPAGTSTPTTEPPPAATAEEQIGEFANEFADLVGAGSGEFAFERLHPVVLSIFGEDLCRDFVDREIVLIRDYQIAGPIVGPTAQAYETPDGDTDVEVYSAPVTFTFQDQPVETTGVFAFVDGEVRWFTQCR